MTKTLTEQWREGTLEDGWYYLDYDTQETKVEIKDGRMYMDGIIVNRHSYGDDIDLMSIKGSVPSYDEHCNLVFQANKPKNPLSDVMMCYDTEREKKVVEPLQKKLEIATKALERYSTTETYDWIDSQVVAKKALKEMEGVK